MEARACLLSHNRRSNRKHLPAIFETSQVKFRLKLKKTKLSGVNLGGNEKRGIIKMPLTR
jgi:hypothetical protein